MCVHWRFTGRTPPVVPFYKGDAVIPVLVFDATRKTSVVVRAGELKTKE